MPHLKLRIGYITAFFMISLALIFDGLKLLIDFITVGLLGWIVNPFINIFAQLTFWFWFTFLGVSFMKSSKLQGTKIASMVIPSFLGLLPWIGDLPYWTSGVIMNIAVVYAEDLINSLSPETLKMVARVAQKTKKDVAKTKPDPKSRPIKEVSKSSNQTTGSSNLNLNSQTKTVGGEIGNREELRDFSFEDFKKNETNKKLAKMANMNVDKKAEFFANQASGTGNKDLFDSLSAKDRYKMTSHLQRKERNLKDQVEYKAPADILDKSEEGRQSYTDRQNYLKQQQAAQKATRDKELVERYNSSRKKANE